MPLTVDHRKLLAILAFILVGALGVCTPVRAEPVITQANPQGDESTVDTGPSMIDPSDLAIEEAQNFEKKVALPSTASSASTRSDRMLLPAGPGRGDASNSPATDRGFNTAPDSGSTIHSSVKEAVRPVYDQLVESGAVEVWHDVKAGLGLNKNKWSEEEQANASPNRAGQVDAANASWQDPGRPPKTAAQAQMDRELDAFMMKKLIDDVKPWFFGLVGLYALGYLVKAGFEFIQWKSARRRERRAARAGHRPTHHAKGVKPDA
jgi:hypothetical protein